jgi:hypothetical protein
MLGSDPGAVVWRGVRAVRHLWRCCARGTVESVSEHGPILESGSNRLGADKPPRIGPMTAAEANFGWAVDVIARRVAADAFPHRSSKHQHRALPPAVSTAVYARLAELAETMRPSHDEFEAAFDIAVHGIGEPI